MYSPYCPPQLKMMILPTVTDGTIDAGGVTIHFVNLAAGFESGTQKAEFLSDFVFNPGFYQTLLS
jgi:hypothetical protein